MDNPMAGGAQIGGEATAIVQTLRDFGRNRSVPVALVARLVGRRKSEISDSLDGLKDKGVIRVDVDKDLVTLIL